MAEYIERETLKQAINSEINEHAEDAKEFLYERGYNNGLMMSLALLLKAPAADVVEVVRCGNCRNRYEKNWAKCQGRRPDEFCSDGVSRFKE